jgi:hypothetical protein
MRRSNCLIWAVAMWLRRGGLGYVSIRRSRWGRFPHFLYTERRRGVLRMVSYVPVQPRHKECPPPVFQGRVRWGDA